MNKHWNKFFENWTALKWWGVCVSTALLVLGYISEFSWVGIVGGLLGITRGLEYLKEVQLKKNGKQ